MSRTKEEMVKAIAQVRKAIEQGEKVHAACEAAGIHVSTWYYAKRNSPKVNLVKGRKTAKLTVTEIPMTVISTEKLFMIYGTPSMLANFAKGLS